MSQVTVGQMEDAALLVALKARCVEARFEGSRVMFVFDDPSGKIQDVLARHTIEGVKVNSLAFTNALRWAKDTVFSTRRRSGQY